MVCRAYTQNKFTALTVRGNEKKRELRYTPNGAYNGGIGIDYDWLGFEFGFQIPENDGDEKKYGVTESWGLTTNMFMRKVMVDVSVIKYQGFYNHEVNDEFGIDTIFKRADISTTNLGVSGNYIFNNKKFSFRAAYLQNESQLKSAGTAFAGAFFYRTGIQSDKGFIPDVYKEHFPNIQDVKSAVTWQLGLQGGYAHTFVIKHFYITGSLGLGVGYAKRSFNGLGEKRMIMEEEAVPKAQFRFATGYDGEKLAVGFQGMIDAIRVGGFEQYSINYSFGSVRVFVAYRIVAPKHLQFIKKINPFNIFSKKDKDEKKGSE